MDTNELIGALVADKHRPAPLAAFWWGALAAATVVAAIVFFATIGPRPDIEEAARSGRFLFKFAVTLTLAASAFAVVRALSRPSDRRHALAYTATAPALLAAAVMFELLVLPPATWASAAVGTNALVCLAYIPLIGIGPLVLF
ncbi:NrsF family protein, partial [Nitratireductor sp. GCM10026969]|uniref:NrsF family protein n=1 Tax=Nitratireductor sp. GCM10026969 TaxID=3252645 RepID=UPI00361E8B9D